MININDLRSNPGATKATKRLGRGQGSGTGTTGGRGNNGYHARRGSKHKAYFEGGQTPLTRRIPKRGFNNRFRVEYQIVNVRDLEKVDFGDAEINSESLYEKGLIHSEGLPVKILGDGNLTKKISVRVNGCSKSAREKIEGAKGKVEVI